MSQEAFSVLLLLAEMFEWQLAPLHFSSTVIVGITFGMVE
jgi:hypothetical protein